MRSLRSSSILPSSTINRISRSPVPYPVVHISRRRCAKVIQVTCCNPSFQAQ
jgi:hypothetical protein